MNEGSSGRPRDDQPDEIWIGEIGPIPIFHNDDFRLEEHRARLRQAAAVADALHSADELAHGMSHPDELVRIRVVPRLIARGGGTDQAILTLTSALANDPSAGVRDIVATGLGGLPFEARINAALQRAVEDEDEEVRSAARTSLLQYPDPAT